MDVTNSQYNSIAIRSDKVTFLVLISHTVVPPYCVNVVLMLLNYVNATKAAELTH